MKRLKIIAVIIFVIVAFFMGACSQKNPLEIGSVYTVSSTSCIGCAKCYEICPYHAISMVDNKAIIEPTKCMACGKCVTVCPVDAIK